MAQRVIEANYEEMINALRTAAKNILELSKDMLTASQTCANALGEGDEGAAQILEKVVGCVDKYSDAATAATDIASKMKEELDRMRKEREVWASDM